jgi:hypothetical protein
MSDLYQTSADLRASVADLARQERPGAALTLTRSGTLSITTAGTTITWQTETRNQGFTWSTTDITIPTSGYYAFSLYYAGGSAHTAFMRIIVNGVSVAFMASSGGSSNVQSFVSVRHFTTGDVLRMQVVPSTNQTIAVNAEGVAAESPIFHIVQLTGVI